MKYYKKNNFIIASDLDLDLEEATESEWNAQNTPTMAEQKLKRAFAYCQEVDPITSHIQRLRDEEEPDEEKIAELIEERAEKVDEIKERYPYQEEN